MYIKHKAKITTHAILVVGFFNELFFEKKKNMLSTIVNQLCEVYLIK